MVRMDVAKTERFAIVLAVAVANALLLGTFPVLERISAAVCIPIPTLLLHRLLTIAGFSLRLSSRRIHLLP